MIISKLRLSLIVLGIVSLFASSCNTISGIGRDMSRFGQGMSNTAEGREF